MFVGLSIGWGLSSSGIRTRAAPLRAAQPGPTDADIDGLENVCRRASAALAALSCWADQGADA
jgi:hypothetical protein